MLQCQCIEVKNYFCLRCSLGCRWRVDDNIISCPLHGWLSFAGRVGFVVWNQKFLWLQIFDGATSCTDNLVCNWLKNCAEKASVLVSPGAAICNLNGKILNDRAVRVFTIVAERIVLSVSGGSANWFKLVDMMHI